MTNTSLSPANLVSVNLDPLGISGAQLISDPGVAFDTVPPGQSVTAKFRLLAQQTGDVTASSFTGEADGGIRLFTGVGERGVPLAPNAIVLPVSTNFLPASLVAAAQRVLGQAFSIATAPAEALPPEVLFVRRQTVVDRGLELAEAGQRLQFGDSLENAVRDLLLDWLGIRAADPGFDQLMRTTDAGRAFLHEVSLVLGPGFTSDVFPATRLLAEQALARSSPLAAAVRTTADSHATLRIARADGVETSHVESAIPRGAVVTMSEGAEEARLIALVAPDAARYTVEAVSNSGGVIDFAITAPTGDARQLQFVRFDNVALDAGGRATVIVDLTAPAPLAAHVDRDGDGVVDETIGGASDVIVEQPLEVVDVLQLESSTFAAPGDIRDPATYGLLVGVLFNKPTTEASVEAKSNYAVEANKVIGAAQQVGSRLVYLYLQRPVGGLVPRSLTVENIADTAGNVLSPATRPIRMVLNDGGRVLGQVREASGSGVPNSVLSLVLSFGSNFAFTVSRLQTDAQGSFDFDFVPRIGTIALTAQHPQTQALASVQARLRGAGESLLLNPTFLGSGTVRGRVLAADGVTAVPGATVALIPGAVLSNRGYQTTTNDLGEFMVADVPVGVFTLRAIDGRQASGQVTGLLERPGDDVSADVVVIDEPQDGGRLIGRVFLSDGQSPAVNFRVLVGTYDRQRSQMGAADSTTTDETGSFSFGLTLPAKTYDVVAVDTATGQVGSTRAAVIAQTTSAVSIVMEATGAVQGVVFDAGGQPVAGAIVAGGVALAETDANGHFRIEGVPAGKRLIEAGDPVSRRRGSAQVNVLPGQEVVAAITLEARATITGRVLDASGQPVPGVSVRIPQAGGYTFVIANNQGVFTFPDMPLGDYLLQAPGPSAESLIGFMEANGIDPNSAFTSGDGPGAPPSSSPGDLQDIIAAYQNAVQTFLSVDESLLGIPDEDRGGFGWNRVRLFQDAVTQAADIRFLAQGTVSGHTADAAGRPTGALVRISALKVSQTGAPSFGELERKQSDAATGAFIFGGIARFDLATFQTAGVKGGDFTLEAAQQFSPVIVQFRDQLNTATPDLNDVVLQFPAAAQTNGTARGIVLMPDGITPAPAGTAVRISFGDLTVLTGADGRFASALPIPAGPYTFTAQTPSGGLRAQATAVVPAGGEVDVAIRLLGLGAVLVQARRATGEPVANATVRLRRGTFPSDQADGVTDASGQRRFVNLTEGPFSVEVEEAITGLTGRASGVIGRDGETSSVVTLTASGRVTGTFLNADATQPIPFAQIALSGSGVQAFTTTDAQGRFELTSIPIGAFTIAASDAATGRAGRAQGQLSFEGQSVDVTVLQLPRGTVAGYVLNADGTTAIPAANVDLSSSSFIATRLQVTTGPDGSFRIVGVPAGSFRLTARDPLSGADGEANGTISAEGEIVDRNVVLAPFGAIRVTVVAEDGLPASNVNVSVAGRTAAVDVNGQFTFENLRLGSYTISGVSLADEFNGGRASATIDEPNEVADVTLALRGVAPVTVRVVASDGVTPVAAARVTLNAEGSFGQEPPGPTAATMLAFTDGTGTATFPSVPLGDYSARAESAALGGVATGATPGIDEPSEVTVVLGASASLIGRVLLPDGVTSAFGALVTLNFKSQSGLQSGVLQVAADINGRFAFSGIPLGTTTLAAFEVVSAAVRNLSATLTADGETFDFGSIVLDNSGPRVVSVAPADGSTGVAPNAAVVVTFSEPVQRQSVIEALSLRDGATLVAGTTTLSADRLMATFTPTQPLRSSGFYTLAIAGAPDGPRDDSNLAMIDALISTFTVRDVIPPAVVAFSPADSAREVAPEATVRVTFSEPVASATLTLRDAAGQVVPAVSALAFGGTAVVASPVDFLQPNATYSATVGSVRDVAGNDLVGGQASATFRTVDTIAPLITALNVQGTPRAGASVLLIPALVGDDISRVEYLVNEVSTVVTSGPFSASVDIPGGATAVNVSARAIDQTGNRSAAFTLALLIEENLPPTVQLTNLANETVVAQGATLQFDVAANDDVGVGQLLFSSVGAVTANIVDSIAGAPPTVTRRYTVNVPLGASPGATFTVQAAAIDAAGVPSVPASISLAVRDGVAPSVSIVEPGPGVQAIPGAALRVLVSASDSGGVTAMTLTCNPVLNGCETRSITPPSVATTQEFIVQVPASLNAPASITLLATATDAAGNAGQAGRNVSVADVVGPIMTGLAPLSGSTRVLAGAPIGLRADATDNVAVVAVDYVTQGALEIAGSAPVVAPGSPASVSFNLAVPADAPNGSTITVRARARDAAGVLSDEVVLQLTVGDIEPPVVTMTAPLAGAHITPGQPITVTAAATDDVALAQIVLSATGAVVFDETHTVTPPVTPAQATFVIPTSVDASAGAVLLTLRSLDAAGNVSAAISREVAIRDATAPAVAVTSPPAGAEIDPRVPLAVTVQASDAVGVAEAGLTTTGLVSGTTTRIVSPAAASHTEQFEITFQQPPVAGGSLTLTGSARDSAGNEGVSPAVTVTVRDVVAPVITTVAPPPGALGVATDTAIVITFAEPMDRATLTAAAVRLTDDGDVVDTAMSIADDDRSVTLTPTSPLAVNTLFTVSVTTTVRDRNGNALEAPFAATFRTLSPDNVPPTVVSIDPADGAVGVGTTVPIVVTFSEPIAQGSVTASSFKVVADNSPVTGAFTFSSGGSVVRFTAASELPFGAVVVIELSGGIADLANNPLVNTDGSAVVTPITATYVTGEFAIVSPSEDTVIERRQVTVEARGAASLEVDRVIFTVNGVTLPAVTTEPFARTVIAPAADGSSTFRVVASARNASNAEIARAERTYQVRRAVEGQPSVVGLDRGATGRIRFVLGEPAPEDLLIALSVVDPAVVSLGADDVTIVAGQTSVDVELTACATCPLDPPARAGALIGSTSVLATSSRGVTGVSVSISDRIVGQTVDARASSPAVSVVLPPSAGQVVVNAAAQVETVVALLLQPAAEETTVSVSSSNPAVATAVASSIAPGETVTTLSVTSGTEGVATLTLRAGDVVRSVTVFVGAPPANRTPIALAPGAGFSIALAPSAGQIIVNASQAVVVTVPALGEANESGAELPVSVFSSNPNVATATASAVLPGEQVTNLSITTGVDGVAVLTMTAGSTTRSVTVFVGVPPPSQTPMVFARGVGIAMPDLPFVGQVSGPVATNFTVGVVLLPEALSVDTTATITTTDAAVASPVTSSVLIGAGSRVANIEIATGDAGTATLILEAAGITREFVVFVGTTPPANRTPVSVAAPIGISVIPDGAANSGRIFVPEGASVSPTIGVQLIAAALPNSAQVTVTTSNPEIVSFGASRDFTTTLAAGESVVPVTFTASGVEGTSRLSFEINGQRRELIVIVGNPPASEIPAVTAPAVLVRVP